MSDEDKQEIPEEVQENFEKMASAAFLQGFEDEMQARGLDGLVTEDSLEKVYKAADVIDQQVKTAEAKQRPFRTAFAQSVVDELVEGGE